jgi:hypothetical protein
MVAGLRSMMACSGSGSRTTVSSGPGVEDNDGVLRARVEDGGLLQGRGQGRRSA